MEWKNQTEDMNTQKKLWLNPKANIDYEPVTLFRIYKTVGKDSHLFLNIISQPLSHTRT